MSVPNISYKSCQTQMSPGKILHKEIVCAHRLCKIIEETLGVVESRPNIISDPISLQRLRVQVSRLDYRLWMLSKFLSGAPHRKKFFGELERMGTCGVCFPD